MARDGHRCQAAELAAALGCSQRSRFGTPRVTPSAQCWHGGLGEKPTSLGRSPPQWSPAKRQAGASSSIFLGVLHRLGRTRAPGCWKTAGGVLEPPKMGGCWAGGAARGLAQPQQPSSRGGGVVAHSLQTNHPSFIANSSPQARMGCLFTPPTPPISLKCNSFHQNLVSHEAYNEFYIYLKWSDIRHPIIPTPREKHGLDV